MTFLIGKDKVIIDQRGDKKYAESEVERIDNYILSTARIFTQRKWENLVKAMEEKVEKESREYRANGRKERDIKKQALEMMGTDHEELEQDIIVRKIPPKAYRHERSGDEGR